MHGAHTKPAFLQNIQPRLDKRNKPQDKHSHLNIWLYLVKTLYLRSSPSCGEKRPCPPQCQHSPPGNCRRSTRPPGLSRREKRHSSARLWRNMEMSLSRFKNWDWENHRWTATERFLHQVYSFKIDLLFIKTHVLQRAMINALLHGNVPSVQDALELTMLIWSLLKQVYVKIPPSSYILNTPTTEIKQNKP